LGSKYEEWDCGRCSKAFVEGMLAIGEITCEPTGIDKYKRTLATCFVNNIDINKEIVRAGYGLAYKQYSEKYTEDEDYARENKKGIWSGQFISPEEFRRQKQNKDIGKLVGRPD
jgi:endonuclease YncB( thermonuclease family)